MWPDKLRINAWTGVEDADQENLGPGSRQWAGQEIAQPPKHLRPGPLIEKSRWEHPDIGWGLVLPDDPALPVAQRATADDAPQPLRDLVAQRKAPVLRYADDLPKWALRRCYADGTCHDPSIVSSDRGTKRGAIPQYLLIYGSPDKIPWELQYRLNSMSFVGRLDLEGEALKNYVDALQNGWENAESQPTNALIWATDHGKEDITRLMRRGIAEKVHEKFRGDPDGEIVSRYINGHEQEASGAQLIDALQKTKPGLIVTTSHGLTEPLGDPAKLATQVGLLVDGNRQPVPVESILAAWQPDGAIWYAHACCSAGSDSTTSYQGLVKEGTLVDQVLKGVAASGARVAPLPRALLGAKRPLRAFIGQVEPTFDWTIRQQETGQLLTGSLQRALYEHLYQPQPLGMALDELHQQGPRLNTIHVQAKKAYAAGEDRLGESLAARLMAVDRESLVILGDPTVAFPAWE